MNSGKHIRDFKRVSDAVPYHVTEDAEGQSWRENTTVFDEEWNAIVSLPGHGHDDRLLGAVVDIYYDGKATGENIGAWRARRKIRLALGLKK